MKMSSGRKQNLVNFVKSVGKSLNFLWKELSQNYKSILTALKTTPFFGTSNTIF